MTEFSYQYVVLCMYIAAVCLFIPFSVLGLMGMLVMDHGNTMASSCESKFLEFGWTLAPTLIVVGLCYCNVGCVGLLAPDEITHSLKVMGRQWYWTYELGGELPYDSIMLDFIDVVDKPLRLVGGQVYQLSVTSADVIHSFSLPELFVKVDAIPGRINQSFFITDRLGVFVGYCSELCGAGHAYMPIVVEVLRNKLS